MTTLNSAFHTLLATVGDLKLNDGDFLVLNNLLKKAYESHTDTVCKPINVVIKLHDGIQDDLEICVNTFVWSKKHQDGLGVKITYQGETKIAMIYRNSFREYVSAWISRMKPKQITFFDNGITTNHSYMKTLRFMKETDDARNKIAPDRCVRDLCGDCEDCQCECECPAHFVAQYGYGTVMSLITTEIVSPLEVEWQRISSAMRHADHLANHS
jgi:hypothetical protein